MQSQKEAAEELIRESRRALAQLRSIDPTFPSVYPLTKAIVDAANSIGLDLQEQCL